MPELVEAFRQVAESEFFSGGPAVGRLEAEFAAFCEMRHAVGVGSGTDAIWLSLMALGIGPGDEVITVPNSFVAVAEAVTLCGARPVFVDVDERTYTMDPAQLEAAITMRTQAIIPVHLFGQMTDMDPVLSVARRYGTPVIEEVSHAPGARQKGRRAGSLGVAGCFSFFPSRNLGALGEAGAITTDEPDLRARLQMLRDHGQTAENVHAVVGWNARMDGLQGAVLSLKLRYLEANNQARGALAKLYDEALAEDTRVVRPFVAPGNLHVFHLYVVRIPNRDEVLRRMAARGVQCGVHYPVPVHLQKAFQFLGLRPGSFPVTERCAREILSLPLFPGMTADQVEFVVTTLKDCMADLPVVREGTRVSA